MATPARPAPDSFVMAAKVRSISELRSMYNAGHETVMRWFRDTGTEPFVASKNKGAVAVRIKRGIIPGPPMKSEHDDAADMLRRHTAVFRCNARGSYEQTGGFWRVGNTVLTPDELLQRAAKYRKDAA